ncbi:ABC1 family-domain-containing protein [Glomus cerebriforme]|uniref:ABC1 family-domain-containing protein n=1 Tax=Glomus cerebriforme TaxID=658196 RepID=A0A397RXT0_9GLOM|nr:ABC1 family-domain-containing protein [Glomus cerebriforme]
MYDEAPAVDYDQVVKIFKEDFKCHPNDMFDDFEHTAVASASIAQVHRAKLKDGTLVAVKVQKPNIRKQMNWDLMAYKCLMHMYEYFFDLPLTWTAETQDKHLRAEADFISEGKNSERTKKDFEQITSLRDKVYIPKVFWDYTSKRVLTCEWIDGVKVTDKEGLAKQDVMKTTIDIFASQIFVTGFVHADPHPGNVFVRPHPNKSKKHYQIVLIDHGLYVEESVVFRHQYSLFWKSLFMMDNDMIHQICHEWGINDPEMFASATLMKPYRPKTALHIASNHKSIKWRWWSRYHWMLQTSYAFSPISRIMSFMRKIPIRSLSLLTGTFGGIYLIDDRYNARTLQRNSLTIWNGICIGLDYKINFRPDKGDKIDDLHERVAQRILRVCKSNGGLYIKLGQAIQVQSAILPPAYQKTFKTMYDEA